MANKTISRVVGSSFVVFSLISSLILASFTATARGEVFTSIPNNYPGSPNYIPGFPGSGHYPGPQYRIQPTVTTVKKDINLIQSEDLKNPINGIAFSRTGKYLATVSDNSNGSELNIFEKSKYGLPVYGNKRTISEKELKLNSSVYFNPDEDRMVVGGTGGNVYLIDVATLEVLKETKLKYTDMISVRFNSVGDEILAVGKNNYISFLNSETLEKKSEIEIVNSEEKSTVYIKSAKYSPEGSKIILAVEENRHYTSPNISGDSLDRVIVYDVQLLIPTLEIPADNVEDADFNPQMNRILMALSNESYKIFDLNLNEVIYSKENPKENKTAHVSFSPDGTHVLYASSENSIKIDEIVNTEIFGEYSIETENRIKFSAGYGIRAATFSPDATMVASGGRSKTLRIFKTNLSEQTVWAPEDGINDYELLNQLRRFENKSTLLLDLWLEENKSPIISEAACLQDKMDLSDPALRVSSACDLLSCLATAKTYLNAPWNKIYLKDEIRSLYWGLQSIESEIKNRRSIQASGCSL